MAFTHQIDTMPGTTDRHVGQLLMEHPPLRGKAIKAAREHIIGNKNLPEAASLTAMHREHSSRPKRCESIPHQEIAAP